MAIYTLNIGMSNNPYDYGQIQEALKEFNESNVGAQFSLGRMAMGEYEGKDEPTFITRITTDWRLSKVIEYVENLCKFMTQSCIAIKSPYFEALVYARDFKGHKELFNNEYFNI